MKKPQTKGRSRIHPTASRPEQREEPQAILKLLPAAIMALAAALPPDDTEVLAYLLSRSLLRPWPPAAPPEKRQCWRHGRHRPLFSCGCFDCYTSFWFRWDSSPDRDLIHQIIEAVEEQIEISCNEIRLGRRNYRSKKEIKGEEILEKLRIRDEKEKIEKTEIERTEKSRTETEEIALEEQREEDGGRLKMKQGGWADVTVLFYSRFWSLWCPEI